MAAAVLSAFFQTDSNLKNSCLKTTPEETQTYQNVLGQIDDLKNRLQKEKLVRKWLEIESKVQRKLIGQLKNLYPIPHLAYPKCILGHDQCPINHMKYNYVKPLTQSCKIPSPIKKEKLFSQALYWECFLC